jgi:chaperonin GroEL
MEGKSGFGFNAQTGEYGDLLEQEVIDPTKVVRNAVENASSIAGMFLTTECSISEKMKKVKDEDKKESKYSGNVA